MSSLPPPRTLVTSLISSISTIASPPDSTTVPANPLQSASPATQKALLTLHVLFPNELLPALDLLDRGLVTRFTVAGPEQNAEPESTSGDARECRGRKPTAAYYVRSAQPQPHNRHRAAAATNTVSYEVRLESWSCSCPAFAFAAFPAASDGAGLFLPPELMDRDVVPVANGTDDWSFGGLTRGADMPACKHLLACVLLERCEIFRHLAVEQEVSVEELAGWAAGWGD